MARGRTARGDLWDLVVSELRGRGCRFRIRRRPQTTFIRIRELDGSTVLREFSGAPLRHDSDEHITIARDRCLEAHRLGYWPFDIEEEGDPLSPVFSWPRLASAVAANIRERIVKEGSRTHLINDLEKRIAGLSGPVMGVTLVHWVREIDPSKARRSFDRRIETLSQIHKSGLLNLTQELEELRNLRPTGAAERLRKRSSQRVRVVPSDAEIEGWLDQLGPFDQWVYGCLATYGLRPHELWHAHRPDDRGWITIPGDLQTKTHTHHAPPVPASWVERYQLRQRWAELQQQLQARWPVKWVLRSGVRIPINNDRLGQYLYKQFTLRGVPRLVATAADGTGIDWARPYDLRHAYAIRCAVHPETAQAFDEDMAEWMGHGVEVHQRTYLRWLPPSRKKASLQSRFGSAPPIEEASLPADVQDKLARLEALEAQLSQLKGLL